MRKPTKRTTDFHFDGHDRRRLENALKRISDKRLFIRVKAVVLVAEGMSAAAVAGLLGAARKSVYNWVGAYLKHRQVSALFDGPRSGRPLTARRLTDRRILEAIKQNPLHLGYHTTVWTVALLAAHLNKCYRQAIGYWTLYRRMKALGLRSKRPRYVYSEKDPNRAQKKGPLCES